MGLRRPIGGAIQILGCAIGIRRRTVCIRILLMRPGRLRFRLRLVLRRTVGMRSRIARAMGLLRPATSRHRDNADCREHHQNELDLLPHLLAARPLCFSFLHLLRLLLRLLHIIGIVVRRSRQILQRLEIREHIVIFEHRQVLQHLRIGLLHVHRWEC